MLTFLIFLLLLIALGFAASRWGYDSRDGLESQEWERRQHSTWPEVRTGVLLNRSITGREYVHSQLAA